MNQKQEKKQIIIKEEDYDKEKQSEWEKTVNITRWEHDFEKESYTIQYKEKE